MAITGSGVVQYRIFDHNCTKSDFIAFLYDLPVQPGQRLLMDNLRLHHCKEAREAMASKHIIPLYIPPYSPRYNAIENVFGVLKSSYRRTCPAFPDASTDYAAIMQGVIERFRHTDMSLYLRHAVAFSEQVLRHSDDTTLVGHG